MAGDQLLLSSMADAPPAWALGSLGSDPVVRQVEDADRAPIRLVKGSDFSLLTAVIPDAVFLAEESLRDGVRAAYDSMLSAIDAEGLHPVRFWNFIPSLQTVMSPGIDRYMVFNSGRFLAYSARATGRQALARTLPTSSGVGSSSAALTIHCFAGRTPGEPVEHARQVPAYEYSFRYGPHPPCFARATLVRLPRDPQPRLLVGGTASVRGEDSVHEDRFDDQLDETLENLASIVGTAASARREGEVAATAGGALELFTDLRIYLPRVEDGPRVVSRLTDVFSGVSQFEVVKADLCRRELLVEIEGVARIPRSS